MRCQLLFLATLAAVAVLGCREAVSSKNTFDAGLSCQDNERIVAGECVFVCDRDGDCQSGERCNLFTGACEPKPPEPDGGAAFPCTTGAKRCGTENRTIEQCDAEGQWQTLQSCPAPSGFCLNEQCLACQPGLASCDGASPSTVTVCLDDGSATRTVTCTNGTTCSQGECRACAPNTTRCSPDGRAVQVCTRTGNENAMWTWVNNGDNFDGTCITQICEQPTPTTAQCKAPACFPGSTQCQSTTVQQVCSPTGAWTSVTCSTLPGYTSAAECQNGACIDECVEAVKAKSYFGCEYWSAVQDNSVEPYFKGNTTSGQGTADSNFAFVVANRSVSFATVTVYRWYAGAEQTVKTVTVPGRTDPATRGLMKIYVPWQSIGPASNAVGVASSGLVRYGYRLTSTRPMTVYQFNPLEAVKITNKACTASEGSLDSTCNENAPPPPTNCCQPIDLFCAILNPSWPICPSPPDPGVCKTVAAGKRCHYYSYSNDASLLLPAHILGTSHVVVSQEHSAIAQNQNQAPQADVTGVATIVGTQNGTQVTFRSSAQTVAGTGVAAMTKGQQLNFTLNRYDVLQIATSNLGSAYIECASNPFGSGVMCRVDNDLTGSVITSTAPVAVFGGSPCITKPYNRVACDHVEEQIFPFATWGKSFVAQKSHPLRLRNQSFSTNSPPDHYKVVAGCPASQCPNGTLVTFSTPPTAANVLPPNRCVTGTSLDANNCRLMGGAHMEFKSSSSFIVTGDQPIAVAQFLPGQGPISFPPTQNEPEQGDPSMILLPPIEQWRAQYTVLAAPGIKDNYLSISIDATKVQSVEVDGTVIPLTSFTAITGSPSGTDYRVRNHPVSVGTHTLSVVAQPGLNTLPGAGVTVYGYDEFVSYGYTGGLDLGTIVTGINPGG
ncbi:MAG: IgGFc-binding protein [Myxococcota bacterium]